METVRFDELQLDERILRAVADMGFEEASPRQYRYSWREEISLVRPRQELERPLPLVFPCYRKLTLR